MKFLQMMMVAGLLPFVSAYADSGELAVSEVTQENVTYFHRGWYIDVVECFDAKVAEIKAGPDASKWFVIYRSDVDHLAFKNDETGDYVVCGRAD